MKIQYWQALIAILLVPSLNAAPRYLRANQVGYPSRGAKTALAFSNDGLSGLSFSVLHAQSGKLAWGPQPVPADGGAYSPFAHTYALDFSAFAPAGKGAYVLRLSDGTESLPFNVAPHPYAGLAPLALNFYLSQRCGHGNPYAGAPCHLKDGKAVGGPHDGELVDAAGGWHDSGDYIKFMITTAWSCENLLLAWRENPQAAPRVLEEAKVALDWIMKMNPDAQTLYYQVGGQEDHALPLGTLPQNDATPYASAPYRPVYYGNGANTCGKAATCLAMAAPIWAARGDASYAARCLAAAKSLYVLGKANPRIQNAKPEGFYTESDWKDDMEWAAAELYRATGEAAYLGEAEGFALRAGPANATPDWNAVNFLAHDALYPMARPGVQAKLKAFMRNDLDAALKASRANPYGMGGGYFWGSMESLTGIIVAAQLYQKRFNEGGYGAMAAASRDYLLGKNPWGVCFIVGLGSNFPRHPQHNIAVGLAQDIPGMPIEGPDSLKSWQAQHIPLSCPDPYAAFQSREKKGGVYHDDVNDYATNECTITQAGLTVLMFAQLAAH